MSYMHGEKMSSKPVSRPSKVEGYKNDLELEDEVDDAGEKCGKEFNIGLDDPIVHVLRNRDGDIVKTFRKSELSGSNLDNTAMLIRIVTLEYQVEVLNNTLMDLLLSYRNLNKTFNKK